MTSAKASKFLSAMNPDAEPAPPEPRAAAPATATATAAPRADRKAEAKPAGRAGLKHIGGYFDRDTVEKVAVLRARLALDNSELLKLAIEDLHKKHEAKRAYGDA